MKARDRQSCAIGLLGGLRVCVFHKDFCLTHVFVPCCSKETRLKFVKRIKELVDEILALRSQGNIVDSHRMDTTIALLVQASNMPQTFGAVRLFFC